MENKIIGRVLQVGDTLPIQSKDGQKTYYKRELVLDATRYDSLTGKRGYENYPSFEFSGDKCKDLDNLRTGDIVTVSFDVSGSKYEKDGQVKFFNRVRGYKIEKKTSPMHEPVEEVDEDNMPF